MPTAGDEIKHYKIIRTLGKGGMGEVFLAQDTILDRKVAIKFLPEEMQQDTKAKERFVREAKSAAALDHPFICKIFETGEAEGKAFIVMEYVEGVTLRDKMEEEPFHLRDSLRVALEIAEALEKAHEKGIIHRDLKPENIMLTPQDHVKVMDFGLAKQILPSGESLTQTLTKSPTTIQGTIMGTLAYMSPEQARGDTLDGRSDIFSLGIIIQEMISGEHPFSKPSAIETLSSILRDPPPSANVKPKTLNIVLSPILKKALAKDPKDRYQSVTGIAADIRNAQKEIIGRPFLHRQLPIIAATAVVIFILIFALIWFISRGAVGPPGKGPELISVLIADFQNQTNDPVFNGALEQLLGISLEGAPFISIYERTKALRLANQLDPSAEGRINPDLAQLISSRVGINVVVNGSIEPRGDGYVVKLWALDPSTSERIAEASREIKTKAEVGKAADYLSGKLRSELGDTQTKSTQAFAKETFTASSLVAMNAFARGQEFLFLGRREEAIRWFLKALDNDPNLGRAYVSLATTYNNLQQFEECEKYFQMAFARIDQMSEREKHRTRGSYYIIKRNIPKAIEEYEALVEKFPYDSVGNLNLALSYFHARDMAKAAEVGRRAVEISPKDTMPRYNLVWYLMGAGDFETAEQEVHALLELEPDYTEGYVCKALIELVQGRSPQAVDTYQNLETHNAYGASLASTGLADIAAYEGRLSDAIAILKKGIDFDLKTDQPSIAADKYIFLAQIYMLQGRKELAVEAADLAIKTSRKEEFLFSAAEIYGQAGEDDKARNVAGELSKKFQPEHRTYAKLIGGELSMKRGDIPGAIQLFQEAQTIMDMWLGRFLLGCAYLEAEAYSEAYTEFEHCLKRRGEATSVFFNDLPSYRFLPPVYYYLGRAQEGLKSPDASNSYEAFLIIKEKGEEDWMVREARKRVSLR